MNSSLLVVAFSVEDMPHCHYRRYCYATSNQSCSPSTGNTRHLDGWAGILRRLSRTFGESSSNWAGFPILLVSRQAIRGHIQRSRCRIRPKSRYAQWVFTKSAGEPLRMLTFGRTSRRRVGSVATSDPYSDWHQHGTPSKRHVLRRDCNPY